MFFNYIICVGIGIIVYILLYLNKLENLNDNKNLDCIQKYNLSLKIPMVVSLIVLILLNNIHYLNNTPNNNIIESATSNIDLFTNNMSYWF